MLLHVNLENGFSHDSVVVLVDGRQVFRKQDVSTNPSAGVAGTMKVNTDGNRAEVEIQVITRNTSDAHEVDLNQTPEVRISLDSEGHPHFSLPT